ncbi:MAG: polyketide cyclase [Acidobacteria bacterium]|nr:MAG: polyketide cyclase [Acidobacteriota bacterium]
MSISLPKPIAEYFAAEKAGDAARLARCFVSDGVVHDEGGTFTGTIAIERWNAAARAKYHHSVEPISSTVRDDASIVVGRVAGDFPNSPIELDHIFRLDGDRIASLEIG